MLNNDRMDVSQGTDINKTSAYKRVYYLSQLISFLDTGFKFLPDLCNGCHDVLMMSINLNDIAI